MSNLPTQNLIAYAEEIANLRRQVAEMTAERDRLEADAKFLREQLEFAGKEAKQKRDEYSELCGRLIDVDDSRSLAKDDLAYSRRCNGELGLLLSQANDERDRLTAIVERVSYLSKLDFVEIDDLRSALAAKDST